MMKKTVIFLYILTLIVLATATLIEHAEGTPFVSQYIYGAGWFSALWALLVIAGLVCIFRNSDLRKHLPTLILHFSMVIILVGAFLTHILAFKGTIHLRGDQPVNRVEVQQAGESPEIRYLPFSVGLDRFEVSRYNGTSAPSDYTTVFKIIDGAKTIPAKVSMNHIFTYKGIRFYQASYDMDGLGSYLSINSDPYGITVTYIGYALLFLSLFWLLLDPKGTFRQLLRSPSLRKGVLTLLLLVGLSPVSLHAATVIPRETAEKFGKLLINYNDRICPLETFALDFTQKLHGNRNYNGANADQVVMSWIFHADEWEAEPFIHVKDAEMRRRLGLPEYAATSAFFRNSNYILGPLVMEYSQGNTDKFHKACADIDGKLQLAINLRQGNLLTVFPHRVPHGPVIWYAPTDSLPPTMSKMDLLFIRNLFPLLYAQLQQGQTDQVDRILDKTLRYQEEHGGNSIPGPGRIKAEQLYNHWPLTTVLFIVNLSLGLFLFILVVVRTAVSSPQDKPSDILFKKISGPVSTVLLVLSGLTLTLLLTLRWIINGNIPLSNGYETMLAVAWFCMLVTATAAIIHPRMALLYAAFGFLLSGFFLLVSHIGQMDPAIGPMMPVLNSPLLSVHVSIMMMSYALLALTFLCGLTALLVALIRPSWIHEGGVDSPLMALQDLSRIFLYPAMVTLGPGIFIGAIWANVSWGSYWSWDPKETWALITFMVYAVPLHTRSLPAFRRPLFYHTYIVLAFLTIIMTYFGVNYFLSGMHSYA